MDDLQKPIEPDEKSARVTQQHTSLPKTDIADKRVDIPLTVQTTSQTPDPPATEVLLKQYETIWQQINHLDASYIQLTLLYMALIGAYIGVADKNLGKPIIVIVALAAACAVMLGIIMRLRSLIDEHMTTSSQIERLTHMVKPLTIQRKWPVKIKTSQYLEIIVVIMTSLAIILTAFQ